MLEFWNNLALKIDPVAFSIKSIEIRYYSLAYIIAFTVTYLLILYRLKFENLSKKFSFYDIETLALISFLSVIIGGRLGYVLFYDLAYFIKNPLLIVYPFNASGEFIGLAGMSFHGGLIAVIVSCMLFAKYKKWSIKELSSLLVPCIPLGYMFGRIGNFFNNELWGSPTDFVLGMYVKVGGQIEKLHPSQLYEAFFEGFLLFIFLWIFRRRNIVKNYSLPLFLFGYGFFRFFIEYVRIPDAHIGYIWGIFTMGQILCLLMIIAAFVIAKMPKFIK